MIAQAMEETRPQRKPRSGGRNGGRPWTWRKLDQVPDLLRMLTPVEVWERRATAKGRQYLCYRTEERVYGFVYGTWTLWETTAGMQAGTYKDKRGQVKKNLPREWAENLVKLRDQ